MCGGIERPQVAPAQVRSGAAPARESWTVQLDRAFHVAQLGDSGAADAWQPRTTLGCELVHSVEACTQHSTAAEAARPASHCMMNMPASPRAPPKPGSAGCCRWPSIVGGPLQRAAGRRSAARSSTSRAAVAAGGSESQGWCFAAGPAAKCLLTSSTTFNDVLTCCRSHSSAIKLPPCNPWALAQLPGAATSPRGLPRTFYKRQ